MQKAVEMKSQGLTLRGMLHMPDNAAGKVPAVTIFHGFTGNKMEPHFIFVKLSRMLEKKGIASVRFDFGGSGESDGDFIDMTLSGEILDAHNILDFVKQLDGIDPERLGAVGLSMGGAVASALAGQRKDDIKCLCLWAPAGNMGELIMRREDAKNIDGIKRQGYAEYNGLRLGLAFFEDVLKVDIFKIASKFDRNVLIIHGDNDTAVPVEVSERYLKYYEGRASLKLIKDADHTFNNSSWEEEVIALTCAFMEKELINGGV
jgi:hypothetical protein